MTKFLILSGILMSLNAMSAQHSLTLFEGEKWGYRPIEHLRAYLKINSKDEVGIKLRVVTQKRQSPTSSCGAGVTGKNCRVSTAMRNFKELYYVTSEGVIYFDNTPCAKVERKFPGPWVKMFDHCQIKINKKDKHYTATLIDYSQN